MTSLTDPEEVVLALRQVHPVLPVRDMDASLAFYVERLGFTIAFHYPDHPAYAGVTRDGVELHLQWHAAEEWERTERPMLRFLVDHIDALHAEIKPPKELRATSWGTREFGVFDPDGNGLTFYELA